MDSNSIIELLADQSALVSLVFVIVLVATWTLRNASAHWRYLLWLVVLAKCFTPPIFDVRLPISSQREARRSAEIQLASVMPDLRNAEVASIETAPQQVASAQFVFVQEAVAFEQPQNPVVTKESTRAERTVASVPSVARASTSISFPFSLTQALTVSWAVVAGLMLVRLLGKIWATRRRFQRTRSIDTGLHAEALLAASDLGMTRLPMIYLSREVTQPLVWGIFRGDVYLPSDFARSANPEHRQAVLKHELAHVHRYDAIINLIQSIAQAVFFFHPLVWWANHKLRQEREKCCDEIVLSDASTQPQVYCQAIVAVLERQTVANNSLPVLAVTGSAKNLEDRIKTILCPARVFRRRPSAWMAVVGILVASVLLPFGVAITARAQSATDTAVETTQPTQTETETNKEADVVAAGKSNWAKGQVLDFQVITSTGEPIPDTELTLQNLGEGIDFQDVKTVKTNTDGRALLQLTDLPAKAVRVYPYKKGFVPLRVYWEGEPHAIMPKKITIPLQKGHAFGGIVQNESGEPISDAEVRIHYYGPGEGKNPHVRANFQNAKTTTDKAGRWRFDNMPEKIAQEELRVYFEHPDYISDREKYAHISIPVIPMSSISEYLGLSAVSVMRKGETLAGKVVDQDGAPIAGAKIHDCEGYWWLEGGPRAVTDEDGEFFLRGFDLTALTPRESRELRLTVQADGFAPELVELPPMPNNDGFRVNPPRNGLHQVVPQGPPETIRVELKPAQTASGRVIDTHGKPIEGVSISASHWRSKRGRLHLESETDDDGRFTLTGMPVDEVTFDFRKGERFMSSENVPIKSTSDQKNLAVDHVVTLRQVLKVEGNVFDAATGEPLPNYRLITGLSYEDGRAPDWCRGHQWGKKVVKEGKYEVSFSQDLAWQVRIEADGYMPAESRVLREDDANGSKFKVDFRLEKAGPITGAIVGPNGKPVANAKVYMPTQRMNTEFQNVTSYEDRPPTSKAGSSCRPKLSRIAWL